MANAKRKRVAWGITGAGDKLAETLAIMRRLKQQYESTVRIEVYLSHAGEQVVKSYGLLEDLKASFERVFVEVDANVPFLAGWLQLGRVELLVVAPASSNTAAKLSVGITDSLLTNATIMSLKAFRHVYVLPTDMNEGTFTTKLPDGKSFRLRVRKEDVANARRLKQMEFLHVLEKPEEIVAVFESRFRKRD